MPALSLNLGLPFGQNLRDIGGKFRQSSGECLGLGLLLILELVHKD